MTLTLANWILNFCYVCLIVIFSSRNHAESDDVVELTHTVEIPIDTVKNRYRTCTYKYCVISDANELMKCPFEFITGHGIRGGIINRYLKLLCNNFEKGSKFHIWNSALTNLKAY